MELITHGEWIQRFKDELINKTGCLEVFALDLAFKQLCLEVEDNGECSENWDNPEDSACDNADAMARDC